MLPPSYRTPLLIFSYYWASSSPLCITSCQLKFCGYEGDAHSHQHGLLYCQTLSLRWFLVKISKTVNHLRWCWGSNAGDVLWGVAVKKTVTVFLILDAAFGALCLHLANKSREAYIDEQIRHGSWASDCGEDARRYPLIRTGTIPWLYILHWNIRVNEFSTRYQSGWKKMPSFLLSITATKGLPITWRYCRTWFALVSIG